MSVTWQVGDRVYVVAQPELTGTVDRVYQGTAFPVNRVVVTLDDQSHGLPFIVCKDAELECYTRPAVDEDETERARR